MEMQMARAKSFSHIGDRAINVLARLAARNAIKDQLRADGVRVTLVPPRVVAKKANEYLASHPEFYQQALERALRMGLIKQHPLAMER
jgi:hypothetical protein